MPDIKIPDYLPANPREAYRAGWIACAAIAEADASVNAILAQPQGEMAELVAQLNETATALDADWHHASARLMRRAAALLTRQAPQPVPVSERLPEADRKVLAHYVNSHGKGRTICAVWVPAKSRSDSGGEEDFTEYDEETDTFYWPEGWYEVIENWDDLGYVKVYEGEVVYWQPLPTGPALPLPTSGEGQP